jgi:uridine monophosphate synthetase
MIDKESLIGSLHDLGAVKFSDTGVWGSGRAPMTLDMQVLVSRPATLRRVARIMQTLAANMTYDRIAAVPMGGLAIGVALGLTVDKPIIYQRLMGRESTVGRYLAGEYKAGETAIVVDDVLEDGTAMLEHVGLLEMVRLKVSDVLVLLDRQLGGREALEAKGYHLHAILTLPEIFDTLRNLRRLTPEQHRQLMEWFEQRKHPNAQGAGGSAPSGLSA